ncbi:WD40 repeat-like protein [Violaceomyces palustris]|uniref:WD40 repeat-like protein n=1 Tax=Violaceomyces palustris TaxID=1673888 RepID=A0ACD0NZ33_9BASI|nr:WD40 repeat-like protein [Violaceomyces palustris]
MPSAADATVLSPEQVQEILRQQQQHKSSAPSTTAAVQHASQSKPRLKTSFAKSRSFEPFYTGGSVAFTPDGSWMATTLSEEVVVTEVKTGNVITKIPGDTEELTSLTLTPSGSHLITASRSLSLKVYSLPEFNLVRSIAKCHAAQVTVMSVDPTSTLLATGSSDGTAKVWDIVGGYCTHVFRGHGGVVSSLCWNMPSPAAEEDSGAGTSASPKAKGKRKSVQGEANVNGGRRIELFSGSVDGRIRLWDLKTRSNATHKPVSTLAGHDSVVRGLSVTDNGKTLVSGARDRTVVIWRLWDGVWRQAETLTAGEGVESVGFLATGSAIGKEGGAGLQTIFWTGGAEGSVRLWSASTGQVICREPQTTSLVAKEKARASDQDAEEDTRAIVEVHYIPAIATIASVHADQNIVMRSVNSRKPLSRTRQLVGFNDEIVDLSLLSIPNDREAKGESHLALATNSAAIRVYTLESLDFNVELLRGHTEVVLCLDRSPDTLWLASGSKDRTARVWAWLPHSRLPKPENAAADSTDVGEKVVRNGSGTGEEASGSSGGEWVCVAVCEGHAESVGAVAFAKRAVTPGALGAPFLVTASQDRTVKVWDLSKLSGLLAGDEVLTAPLKLRSLLTLKIHDKDINSLDIAPNNALLASGSQDRTAKVFSLSYTAPSKANNQTASASLKPLATCKGHKRGVWSVKFSPVDLALATASGDKTVRLWSLKDYSCVKIFEGHTNSVLRLQFASAGMQLFSSASDGLVKLWNVKDEECVETLDGHEEKVWSIVVRKDESEIISAGADSVVNIWEDRTVADEIEKAKEREELVEREQDFSNFLTLKDYRNAIALALSMNQPRRLLNLFSNVANSRPEGDAATSVGLLLESALRGESMNASSLSEDKSSITGLKAVDQVISQLGPSQLIQLLSTCGTAQTILHAILRLHPAQSIIEAFEDERKREEKSRLERLAMEEEEEEEEEGAGGKKKEEEEERRKKAKKSSNTKGFGSKVDLAGTIDAILPYTERHYARAERTLIESAMLEFTLSSMDSLLGGEEDDDEEERREIQGRMEEDHVPANHAVDLVNRRDDSVSLESGDEEEDDQAGGQEEDQMEEEEIFS